MQPTLNTTHNRTIKGTTAASNRWHHLWYTLKYPFAFPCWGKKTRRSVVKSGEKRLPFIFCRIKRVMSTLYFWWTSQFTSYTEKCDALMLSNMDRMDKFWAGMIVVRLLLVESRGWDFLWPMWFPDGEQLMLIPYSITPKLMQKQCSCNSNIGNAAHKQ